MILIQAMLLLLMNERKLISSKLSSFMDRFLIIQTLKWHLFMHFYIFRALLVIVDEG